MSLYPEWTMEAVRVHQLAISVLFYGSICNGELVLNLFWSFQPV